MISKLCCGFLCPSNDVQDNEVESKHRNQKEHNLLTGSHTRGSRFKTSVETPMSNGSDRDMCKGTQTKDKSKNLAVQLPQFTSDQFPSKVARLTEAEFKPQYNNPTLMSRTTTSPVKHNLSSSSSLASPERQPTRLERMAPQPLLLITHNTKPLGPPASTLGKNSQVSENEVNFEPKELLPPPKKSFHMNEQSDQKIEKPIGNLSSASFRGKLLLFQNSRNGLSRSLRIIYGVDSYISGRIAIQIQQDSLKT